MDMISLQGKLTLASTISTDLFAHFPPSHASLTPPPRSHLPHLYTRSSFSLAPLRIFFFQNHLEPSDFWNLIRLSHKMPLFLFSCFNAHDRAPPMYLTASSIIAPHCPGDIWGMWDSKWILGGGSVTMPHSHSQVETIHILSSLSFTSGLRPLRNKLFSLRDAKVFYCQSLVV